MDFEKSKATKLPPIAADASALHAIAAVLSKSGPCKFFHYQDVFDSLDALLAGRELPLERIELDAPAATVSIERSGVTIHHRPEAQDVVRDLQAEIHKRKIPALARAADFYRLALLIAFLMAFFRDDDPLVIVTLVVGALLDHVAEPLIVRKPLVKLPFGMQVDRSIWLVGGAVALILVATYKIYLREVR